MKQKISVLNKQRLVQVSVPLVKKLVAMVLSENGSSDREIGIVLVDDAYIRRLNKRYLRRSGPTDVLSFGFPDPDCGRVPERMLGDVVVSAERAFFRAAEFGKDVSEEICLYVIHGVLHLLGFDDERKTPAAEMRREEERMLACARGRYGADFFRKAVRVARKGGS
jgi:probable rRNA maturation factor